VSKELVINACLAGFWAGVAVLTATNAKVDKVLVVAALAVAARTAVGYVAAKLGKPVPVDQ
jgi:CHASE2 domain-containing sensor protein